MFIVWAKDNTRLKRKDGRIPPRLLPHHFYMRITCKTLLIEQDKSVKKYIAFSELVNLAVDRATTVT